MKASAFSPEHLSAHHDIAPWVEKFGRFGLAARGVVYVVLGLLAAKAGFGTGGRITDQQGAIQEIGQRSPFGEMMLWIVGLGLVGFVLWRLAEAVMDLDHYGHDAKGIFKRAAVLVSGLAYAGVSTSALAFAAGRSAPGGEQATQDRTAWLMAQPFGRWLVGLVGLIILGVALFQFYHAYSCNFTRNLRGGGLTSQQEMWTRRVGRIGHAARGVAFIVIAWFFLQAAMHSDPSEAGGLASALQTLSRQPYGPWLLGLVGTGLGLFGVYSLVEARYRRIG